jgi:Ca2+/Na+ antiporter
VSRWAYEFAFGSLLCYAFFGYRTGGLDGWGATGLLYVWGAAAVIGLGLIGFKAHLIADRRLRVRVTLSDGAMLLAALALIAVLPSFMGMVRGLILLALFIPYLLWWFRRLETIERAEP